MVFANVHYVSSVKGDSVKSENVRVEHVSSVKGDSVKSENVRVENVFANVRHMSVL